MEKKQMQTNLPLLAVSIDISCFDQWHIVAFYASAII